MKWTQARGALLALATALAGLTAPAAGAATLSAQEIINTKCVACHTKNGEQLSRLQQRKSPEGWLMTLTRMRTMHGADLSPEEVRTMVKHLADTQGLAPSETQGARYAMERRLNTVEQLKTEQFTQMCARCHSGARVMLQRRPLTEWEHLLHFHVGQYPTIEYQALGRDRDWVGIAFKEMLPWLAKEYAYESPAWNAWKMKPPVSPAGRWSVAGRWPGKGDYAGVMEVRAGDTADRYTVSLDAAWADGSAFKGSGSALVYTGYEWRADLDVAGVKMRQVLALDGDRASGRMFEREQDGSGGDLSAARQGAGSVVLALQPAHIRAGETATLRVVGTGLEGEVKLPRGLSLVETVSRDGQQLVLRVAAAKGAARGVKALQVGPASSPLAVYDRIDYVKVAPDYAVGRVGGNGGATPVVQGRFEAVAYSAGPDRKAGTRDDRAAAIAGIMNPDTGVFTPAGAGPNPLRRMGTNNAGNLQAVATVTEGNKTLTGKGRFIVTVQRWNNPPLP